MGKVLLVTGGYDHSIRFWDVSSATVVKQIQYPDSPINLLRISPGKSALSLHPLPVRGCRASLPRFRFLSSPLWTAPPPQAFR